MKKLERILACFVSVLVVGVPTVGMIVCCFPRESIEPLAPWLKYGLIGCAALYVIGSLVDVVWCSGVIGRIFGKDAA